MSFLPSHHSRVRFATQVVGFQLGLVGVFLILLALPQGFMQLLLAPLGLLIFFLPAFNVVTIVERLIRTNERLSHLVLWTWILSLTLTPAATYVLGMKLEISPLEPLIPFAWWLCVTLLANTLFILFRRGDDGGMRSVTRLIQQERSFIKTIIGVVIILAVSFLLYPFIPEADGYTYLMVLRRAHEDILALTSDPRSFFLYVLNLVSTLTHLDPYWVLKCFVPFGILFSSLALYLTAQPLTLKPWLKTLAALSVLCTPILLQEVLIARPQSLPFLITLPLLYLLGSAMQKRRGVDYLYWLGLATLACIIGLRIHTLFAVFLPCIALAALYVLWPTLRRYPIESVIVCGLLGLLLLPWVNGTRLLSDLSELANLFWYSVVHNPFHLWFVDQYRNVDGVELGWPGVLAFFYYGYNLGFLLPVLFLGALIWSGRALFARLRTPFYGPAWLFLSFFVLIAEILPRFELAYLPDRAWIFIALTLTLAVPACLESLSGHRHAKPLLIFVILAAALSVGAGTGLTYAKQGWITLEETRAEEFIQTQTASDAVFLGQGGHHVLVRYLGERRLVRPPDPVFYADTNAPLEAFLAQEANLAAAVTSQVRELEQRERIAGALSQLTLEYRDHSERSDTEQIAASLHRLAMEMTTPIMSEDVPQPIAGNVPIYVIYSRNKFRSIYGTRSWYRASNFYGANLEKFTAAYPIVYDQDETTIWKVR